jgi:hypothetical protein
MHWKGGGEDVEKASQSVDRKRERVKLLMRFFYSIGEKAVFMLCQYKIVQNYWYFLEEKVWNEIKLECEGVEMKSANTMKDEKCEKFAVKHINALFCGSYLLTIVLTLILITHISQSPRYDLETFLKFELARHERVKRDEQPKG